MGVQFREGESAPEGAVRIAREHLDKALRGREDGAPGDRDAVVHDVRKRIKKARAMLRLVRGSVGREANRRLRDAARPLSEARDASAMIAALDDLADRPDGLDPEGAFARARRDLVDRRDEVARRMLDEKDAVARALEAVDSTRRRLKGWEPRDEGRGPIPALKRSYKRGRAAFDAAVADPGPDSLHELRKRVKDLGYQFRAFTFAPSSPAARLRRLFGLLADELGQAHDLDVLRAFLEERDEMGAILPHLDHRRADLRRETLLRAGVVFRDKPRAFARALEESPQAEEPAHPG